MKYFLLLFFIILFSCSENNGTPSTEKTGCVILTNKSTNKKAWLTCANREKFNTGYWSSGDFAVYYKDAEFIEVDDCSECQALYPR